MQRHHLSGVNFWILITLEYLLQSLYFLGMVLKLVTFLSLCRAGKGTLLRLQAMERTAAMVSWLEELDLQLRHPGHLLAKKELRQPPNFVGARLNDYEVICNVP